MTISDHETGKRLAVFTLKEVWEKVESDNKRLEEMVRKLQVQVGAQLVVQTILLAAIVGIVTKGLVGG